MFPFWDDLSQVAEMAAPRRAALGRVAPPLAQLGARPHRDAPQFPEVRATRMAAAGGNQKRQPETTTLKNEIWVSELTEKYIEKYPQSTLKVP